MFKVEVTYGSDPIAQAALNRRVHDRLGGGWRLERLAFEDVVEEARTVLERSEVRDRMRRPEEGLIQYGLDGDELAARLK